MNIFDFLYSKYKISKPIKLIELFAGYGSQALALKYLGIPFTHHKICEWAIPSIIAYCDLHIKDRKEFCSDLTKEQIANELYNYGVSIDYNKPATLDQLKRLPESKLRLAFNSILNTNNLVNIQKVKGRDLDFDSDDEVIVCYSFPCQDLSLAGKGAGMSKGSGTRSGLLWEVERILAERERENLPLPTILLMENVPQVMDKNNVDDFNKWQLRLEQFGYHNYHQLLNAKDYGIPQNRNRCFMVSILGDYSYSFPKKHKLKLKLEDLLEQEVSEKYFLSDKQINDIKNWNAYEKPLETMDKVEKSGITPTITTRTGAYAAGMILIKNANKKGYLEATKGDGVDISGRMKTHRGTVQKGMSQTLSTMGENNVGVVINDLRIRKLTPLECWRLMGVKDEDLYKVAKNQSESSLYHLAGDSIVVNVLMAIFSQLL